MVKTFILAILVIIPVQALAWDGYDYQNGTYVEIEKENLVRSGLDIEVYDYSTGKYHNMTVEDINVNGSSVDIEVYDQETEEYRTLEMDD